MFASWLSLLLSLLVVAAEPAGPQRWLPPLQRGHVCRPMPGRPRLLWVVRPKSTVVGRVQSKNSNLLSSLPPAQDRAVVDAGSKVFALDKGAHGKEMLKGFGIVLNKKAVLDRLSEEHGVMLLDSNEQLEIGETVRIIPNHACTVINLSDKAYGIRRGKVEAELLIAGRGKVQ